MDTRNNKNSVVIRYCELTASPSRVKQYRDLLSRGEQERMSLLINRHKRDEYAIFHGTLRLLLGEMLHVKPQLVDIVCSHYGKPYLLESGSVSRLHFSLSRSGSVGVFAFSTSGEIGIDIEKIQLKKDITLLKRNVLTPDELQVVQSSPQELQHSLFYSFWTRKEALLKARGTGINQALNKVIVPHDLLKSVTHTQTSDHLFHEFSIADSYTCTLVANSKVSLDLESLLPFHYKAPF